MTVVYVMLASAGVFAVLAMLAWTGVIDVGLEPESLALLFGLTVVMDLFVAVVFMRSIARR